MALTPGAVRVAGTGEVFIAPEGTAAPTNATAALNAAFDGLGYTSPDGVQFNLSRDVNPIDAWQGSKVREVVNSEDLTLQMTLLETREDTLLAVFGGGTVSGGVFTPPDEGTNTIRAMVVEFTDGDKKYRWYFPRVQISGDLSFNLTRTDAVGYEITFGVLAATPSKAKLFSNDTNLGFVTP